jgi:uncharacterized DUF497 family protein
MFSWDASKAVTNLAKRGVWFKEAATEFSDPDALDWTDPRHTDRELRSKRLGVSSEARVPIVVYTVRMIDHGKESIRIISARQTSRKEREAYFGSPH